MVRDAKFSRAHRDTPRSRQLVVALLVASLAAGRPSALAQVAGGQVIAGEASVHQQGALTTIRAGDQSILRWDRFNIGAPETVQFIQPTAASRVLNYVGGTGPSQIDGRLLANGHVYLMNPYGIYFGRSAVVETAGLFAVAGHMTKEDFQAGVNRFTGLQGAVVNAGSLTAHTVALAGLNVSNTGSIVAPDGFIGLASGDDVLLGERGGRVFVNIGRQKPPVDAAQPGVSNTGTLSAPRGRVVLAAGDLLSMAISNDGVVAGRDISLQGQGGGLVLNSGRIDASTAVAGQTGGRIEITGEKVGLMAGSVVDASGAAGGGTVLVGGDFQGANPDVRNADVTYISSGAQIRADAREAGDGGRIIVWANDTTRYFGDISAVGAGPQGAGGFAEVSGRKFLDFQGKADLRAPSGITGTLLLDPTNIYIAANQANATGAGMVGTDNSATTNGVANGGNFTASGNVQDSVVLIPNLVATLGSANVVVTTFFGGNAVGNITVVDPVSWNTPQSLTLNAINNIVINSGISNAGSGNVNLDAGGAITLGAAGSVTAGNVTTYSVGRISGAGTITGRGFITITGYGLIGNSGAGNALRINTPALTINLVSSGGGGVFVTNGGNALRLTAGSLPAGGDITSGNLTLTRSIDAGTSALRFNTEGFDLGIYSITAGTLTINNAGLLNHVPNEGSLLTANNIILQGAGGVYGADPDGSTIWTMRTNAPVITLSKNGTATTFLGSIRVGGVAVSGTAAGSVLVHSGGFGGIPDQPVTSSGMTISATDARLRLRGSAINLTGAITGPRVELENTEALVSTGVVSAATSITLNGTGRVGLAGPNNALATNTPALTVNKTAGATYVNNGANALAFTPTNMASGGEITAGALTLAAPLNAGNNTVGFNTAAFALGQSINAGAVSINNSGPLSGNGTVTASLITLTGAGAVGSGAGSVVNISTPALTINKTGGAVFASNGNGTLALATPGMPQGGAITAGPVILTTSLNAGANDVQLNTAGLAMGNYSITARTITINNTGQLSSVWTPDPMGRPYSLIAENVVLQNSGAVSNPVLPGTEGAVGEFLIQTGNLTLAKTGTALTYIGNNRPGGIAINGTSAGNVTLYSGGFASLPDQPVFLGPITLTGANSRLFLHGAAFTLGGTVTSPRLLLRNSAPLTGTGLLAAAAELELHGTGAVGAGAAAINLQTPRLIVDKSAGAIYANNGSGDLTLVASAISGGGELSAGNLTLASPLNVGTSPLTLNTAALSLGNFATTAGALVINNSGAVSGSGVITADTLTFRGGGSIGSGIGNNTVIQTQTDTLTFAKTGGDSYLVNTGPLSVSGAAANASTNIRTSGPVSVGANLNVGSGTLRLLGVGGVSQTAGSVITAGALAVSNTGSGNIILEGANAVPLIAALNAFDSGTVSIRSELAGGVAVGSVPGAGSSFATLNGVTTGTNAGGNISVANPAGNLTVDQPVRIAGTGNGTVNIQGATTINANITASANTTVTIAGRGPDLSSDVIINAPLVTGNATITANRDIIVNAPVTVTSTGGLTMAADADNNGTGGVLVTGAGSVTANSLSAALDIRGSSVVNLANIGGAGLGVGSLFYLQAGGAITTVQPVTVAAQPSAPATAGIVVRGSGPQSAITTTGGGITFSPSSGGSVILAGGGLTTSLLSATGSVALGARPITLEGNTRINAASTNFGGLVNGGFGLFLSNAATFGGAVGGATPLASLQVGGAATVNADITTTGAQTFLGAVTGSGRLAAAGITFGGAGGVGAAGAGNAIAINTPSLTLSKTSGAVFANNGGNALSLAASGMPLGGEITAGDVTLTTSINAGASAVTLNTAGLTLGTNSITAGTITVNNTGLLSSAVALQPDSRPYSLIADNVILQNSGGVFDRMPSEGPGPEIAFLVQTGNLTLAKTGTALTYIGNNRAGGLTVVGSAGGDVVIHSGGVGAIPDQPLFTGALALAGTNSRLSLRGSAITLGAGLTSPRLLIQNSGPVTSAGGITSPVEVSLEGIGSVGSATAPIALQTPRLNVNKSAGAVYAGNGSGDLTLSGSTMSGGGTISAGNLTLASALNAGTSPLTLNAARLAVGNFPTTAGALAINNSGEMTGSGIVSAETLTFGGGGGIGTASDAGTVVRTQTGTLTFAKTGGASFLVNTGPVAVSGSVADADINLRASGPVVVGSSLSAGSGIVRLAGTGGVSQTTGSVITASALSASNSGSGHIVLNGSNAVGLLAAANTFDSGTVALRADLPGGLTVGSVAESGPVFPAVNGVTTGTNSGGSITVNNPIGNLTIAQPVRVTGSGNGAVNILGATTVNAAVNAAASTTVSLAGRIEPGPDLTSDTIINVPLTTGNVTITAARDVIVNAPVTVTSIGGLSVVADADNNGTGGVLVTGPGSLVANSLTGPLNIRGSSIANVANIGGPGLGVGSLFYIQAGGTITTVQPVSVVAQASAPATAGIVVHGNSSRPAIGTSGGGIAFTAASGGSVVLDGGSLTSPLLSAAGVVTLGARPITLQGDTRIAAASTIFGGPTDGANGLSISNGATFEAAVGGNVALASLEVAGPATINANVTSSGAQVFSGPVSGPGRLSTAGTLTFAGSGAVGAAGEGNAVNISAPTLVLNKTAGAVFVSTGGAALDVAGMALPAGGSIAAGNLVVTSAFNAGDSTVALTAAGTLGLGGNLLTGGNVTLTHAGALTGNGVINASTRLTLNGDGAVGAPVTGGAINTNTPALTVNKGAGGVFLSNGDAALSLTPTLMPAGGAITAGSLTLAAPLNAGTSALSIVSNGTVALGSNGITAGALTLSHAGALTGGGSITAGNLTLRGGGNVGDQASAIRLQSASVVFDKAGGASFVTNTGPLAISGVTANGDLNVAATGALSVAGNLQVGQGTLRLVAGGGITQSAGSIITAGTLGLLNTGAGNVTLTGANAIGLFAAENAVANGTLSLRSDVAAGSVIGNVVAAGAAFPAVSGVTTRAGNLTVSNAAGGITVNQASQSIGSGTGTVVVSGATLNAAVAAAGGTDVTITGNSTVVVDTVINSPITSGNATISATRDVIVNSTLTATSTGGLALTADSDNSGSGGVLITSAGSVLANSLTQPLVITGSSVVNGQGVGGPGLGVGNIFYIQSGGTIRTVQPVAVAAQSNAPAAAGIGLNGSGAGPAIVTTGGGITFAAPSSATITLNGGSLSEALLTATGPIAFGARPVALAGHTRLSAPSISVGGALNGAFGFSVGGAATFGSTVGGTAPLGSLVIEGPASFGANVTTVGAQTYNGAASLNADVVFATTNNNVVFGSTVNSATATARSMTINAGSGAITANGAIGGTNALNAITLNSIAATTLSAVTAATLVTDAGGGSVLGGAVSAGTVTINDQLMVRGSGVATTGNQTYSESLQVGANVRFASSGGSINFRGTVLPDSQAANRQFEATAPNGIVAAAADIGADANRFGAVLVNGRNSRVSNVFSTGALQLAMGTGSSDVLEITGTRISSTSGTVTLGSVPPKTAAPMRASINKGNAGNLAIDGNQVVFQPYERTSINGGDLSLVGRTSATLGTTSVSGRLMVTTPSLAIYRRSPAAVDLGNSVGMDNGIDIVASSVDFALARDPVTGVATTPLAGVPPLSAFSTIPLGAAGDGRISIATLTAPVNSPEGQSIRYFDLRGAGFSGTTIEAARFGPSTPLLSLVAAGSAAATARQSVAGVLPPALGNAIIRVDTDSVRDEEEPDGPIVPIEKLSPPLVDVELSAALREQLQNLGIFARPLSAEERVARLRSVPFYDQVPRKPNVRDRDYEVVDARVSKESAVAAVGEWQRQFLDPATGQSRVPAIAAALGKALEAYRAASPTTDAAGFRRWLESNPDDASAATALGFVREVSLLFRRIELLGLTGSEVEVSKAQILSRVLQDEPSMRAGFLRRTIEAGAPAASASAAPAASGTRAEHGGPSRPKAERSD